MKKIGRTLFMLLLCTAMGLYMLSVADSADNGESKPMTQLKQKNVPKPDRRLRNINFALKEFFSLEETPGPAVPEDLWDDLPEQLREVPLTHQLRILVIGNSFNQDTMAYVPPILNEILPDYEITYAVLYTSSADLDKHLSYWENVYYYTLNYWGPGDKSWSRDITTIDEILEMDNWDIVMTQATSSDVLSNDRIQNKILRPAQRLLDKLQTSASKPILPVWVQWVGRPESSFGCAEMTHKITDATNTVIAETDFFDFIPIGVAIQSARTNATINNLGGGGELLHRDRVHLAAGLPDLIASYTTVQKILEWTGNGHLSVRGSSFRPADEECVRIGACWSESSEIRMTHGDSVGVTEELVLAAQEIAMMAVENPTEVTNCADILG